MALPSFTYSGVSYAGQPAGTTSFPLTTSGGKAIPYLLRTHIHVYSTTDNGVTKAELSRPAEWNFDATGTAVILKTGIAGGTSIILRRITPDDALYVMFGQGTLLTADQLNDAELFDLYLIQELYDRLMVQLATPSSSFAFWNNQGRSTDPAKGTPQEIAQTIQKLDQLLGDWPADGKDKFIATTDAISARLDPYVQDGTPPAKGLPQKEQNGKTWFDTDDLVQRFWDADAGAWVTLANTGPPGPPGVVAVGATVTLPPGSSAAVTSSVTPSGAVLDFKIPRGDVGPTGLTGLTGPMGPAGPAGVAPVLPAATGTTLGGIKVGSNLDIDTSGVLSAKLPGALIYRGTLAATAAPPASPVSGDVYVLSSAGILTGAGWGAIAGLSVNTGDMLLYTGTAWDHVGSTGGVGGAGVTAVKVAAPITKAGTAAEPLIGVADATAATKGVVQLADAAAITAGTAGRVVDAAQLKAAASAIDGGFANSNYGSAPAAIDGGTATTP